MLTLTCQFEFQDGEVASARLATKSPESDCPVTYSGSVERLPEQLMQANAPYLKVFCERLAKQLDAKLTVNEEGVYEEWSE